MALSIAKEKDTGYLDTELLQRFTAKARVPTRMVIDAALETAEKFIKTWQQMDPDLPLDAETKHRIEDRLKYIPLTRRFVTNDTAPTRSAKSPERKRGRSPKRRSAV